MLNFHVICLTIHSHCIMRSHIIRKLYLLWILRSSSWRLSTQSLQMQHRHLPGTQERPMEINIGFDLTRIFVSFVWISINLWSRAPQQTPIQLEKPLTDKFSLEEQNQSRPAVSVRAIYRIYFVDSSSGEKILTCGYTNSIGLTDTFVVTSPSGQTPPTICGINTGEHSN